jgi:hypothetical protein
MAFHRAILLKLNDLKQPSCCSCSSSCSSSSWKERNTLYASFYNFFCCCAQSISCTLVSTKTAIFRKLFFFVIFFYLSTDDIFRHRFFLPTKRSYIRKSRFSNSASLSLKYSNEKLLPYFKLTSPIPTASSRLIPYSWVHMIFVIHLYLKLLLF